LIGSRYAQFPPPAILFDLFEERELYKWVRELRKTVAWALIKNVSEWWCRKHFTLRETLALPLTIEPFP
jgi:hypothetical protein